MSISKLLTHPIVILILEAIIIHLILLAFVMLGLPVDVCHIMEGLAVIYHFVEACKIIINR